MTTPFAPPPHRPPIRLLNALGRTGITRLPLREDSLVKSARRATGLSDLGTDFESEATRDSLSRLLTALDDEAHLHATGRLIIRSTLVRAIANRLRLEDLLKRHPEIAELPVETPVFIAGLPRTGTTLLHRLLTCESRLRPLLSWEALNPAPFPEKKTRSRISHRRAGRDPRMRLAETAETGLRYLAPEFFAIHPVEAHEVEEDVLLQDGSFMSPTVDATMPVPRYSAWLHGTDQTPMYRYFRRLVQLLLWQRPGLYLGKTPHHLENLDVLLRVFPGARVIHTHRDPANVVPSFCSMMAHGRRVFSDDVDPIAVGRQFHHKCLDGVTRAIAARQTLPGNAFIDIAYADLVSDPMKQVRRIYDFLELGLATETEQRMQSWRSSNPQNKHGVHNYDSESFGLDARTLDRDFAAYRERFHVPREESR